MPDYYRHTLGNGKSVMEVAPTIQWGYLVYLTVFRVCQYFGAKEECQYCDINHNWRQHKAAGRPYTGVKPVEEVLEALAIIDRYDTAKTSTAYTLTGGAITSHIGGRDEADFYGQYAKAIEERFPGRWIGKVVAQALPKADVQRFHDYGVQIYHPNYEVWDRRLFELYCPGKERYVGRDEWHRRILDSADVFGARNVIPNFVAGVEMAEPFGFTTVKEAIDSTTEGLRFFMSHGITPRFTTWCPEPTTPLGRTNPDGAPLEYHIRLLEAYRSTMEEYGLSSPPGYGPPGPGRAVFSVSSFMDSLRRPGRRTTGPGPARSPSGGRLRAPLPASMPTTPEAGAEPSCPGGMAASESSCSPPTPSEQDPEGGMAFSGVLTGPAAPTRKVPVPPSANPWTSGLSVSFAQASTTRSGSTSVNGTQARSGRA